MLPCHVRLAIKAVNEAGRRPWLLPALAIGVYCVVNSDSISASAVQIQLQPQQQYDEASHVISMQQPMEQSVDMNYHLHWVTEIENDFRQIQEQQQQRRLQSNNCTAEDPCELQTPQQVCDQYNNKTVGTLNCTCSRFGTRDVQVDCNYVTPQCFTDNTTCYIGSISQIFNDQLQSRAITSCTTYTSSAIASTPLNTEVCIRAFPIATGNYTSLASCSTSLRPLGSSDEPKVCNSCTLCTDTPTTSSSASSTSSSGSGAVNRKISFNCCNALADAKQTCGTVDAKTGVAIPQYDTIPPDQKGKCTSHAIKSVQVPQSSSIASVIWTYFVVPTSMWYILTHAF
jgi:hypothetical protein